MEEAKSSWNTVYQSKEGFECQITLRDEDEVSLDKRASRVVASITKSGGLPVRRKGFETNNNATFGPDSSPKDSGSRLRKQHSHSSRRNSKQHSRQPREVRKRHHPRTTTLTKNIKTTCTSPL